MAEQKVVGLTPNPPDPNTWVEIEHDGIESTTKVHPRALSHWEARGWRVVQLDAEAPVTAEQEAASQPGQVTAAEPASSPTKKPPRVAASGTEA